MDCVCLASEKFFFYFKRKVAGYSNKSRSSLIELQKSFYSFSTGQTYNLKTAKSGIVNNFSLPLSKTIL